MSRRQRPTGIDLTEARNRIGDRVVYHPTHSPPEDGVITSVNDRWVFVRYSNTGGGVATSPYNLSWLASTTEPGGAR